MEFPDLTLLALFLQGERGPIIVDITEPPKSELSTLSQVLLGSLGLSGVMALMAIVLGIGLGALMFWFRRRSA
ncbi:MAG TPA: hypothetical protein VGJ39_10125 [Vicinamibacterales bacterium]|jgi:ABC-type phosphate transport system permease subunit